MHFKSRKFTLYDNILNAMRELDYAENLHSNTLF